MALGYASLMSHSWNALRLRSLRDRRANRTLIAAAVLIAAPLAACGASSELPEPIFTTAQGASEDTTTTQAASSSQPTTATAATTAADDSHCTDADLRRNPELDAYVFYECEGGFGGIGAPGVGVAAIFVQWNGSEWEEIKDDDKIYVEGWGSAVSCYDSERMKKLGVPESIRRHMFSCDPNDNAGGQKPAAAAAPATSSHTGNTSGRYITTVGLGEAGEDAAYPACDGRNILIIDSVIDQGSGTATQIAQQVLMQHPSGKDLRFTVPGQCPSLRSQVNGQDIYPVYLDYGADTDAMCRAKAAYGGNGRILSNSAEYVDPC